MGGSDIFSWTWEGVQTFAEDGDGVQTFAGDERVRHFQLDLGGGSDICRGWVWGFRHHDHERHDHNIRASSASLYRGVEATRGRLFKQSEGSIAINMMHITLQSGGQSIILSIVQCTQVYCILFPK